MQLMRTFSVRVCCLVVVPAKSVFLINPLSNFVLKRTILKGINIGKAARMLILGSAKLLSHSMVRIPWYVSTLKGPWRKAAIG